MRRDVDEKIKGFLEKGSGFDFLLELVVSTNRASYSFFEGKYKGCLKIGFNNCKFLELEVRYSLLGMEGIIGSYWKRKGPGWRSRRK
jgi:hypothetical protein